MWWLPAERWISHVPTAFMLSVDAGPRAPRYRPCMKTASLIAATGAAGGIALMLAGVSLMLSPEPASVRVLVNVGFALVALSAVGMLARWVLAR